MNFWRRETQSREESTPRQSSPFPPSRRSDSPTRKTRGHSRSPSVPLHERTPHYLREVVRAAFKKEETLFGDYNFRFGTYEALRVQQRAQKDRLKSYTIADGFLGSPRRSSNNKITKKRASLAKNSHGYQREKSDPDCTNMPELSPSAKHLSPRNENKTPREKSSASKRKTLPCHYMSPQLMRGVPEKKQREIIEKYKGVFSDADCVKMACVEISLRRIMEFALNKEGQKGVFIRSRLAPDEQKGLYVRNFSNALETCDMLSFTADEENRDLGQLESWPKITIEEVEIDCSKKSASGSSDGEEGEDDIAADSKIGHQIVIDFGGTLRGSTYLNFLIGRQGFNMRTITMTVVDQKVANMKTDTYRWLPSPLVAFLLNTYVENPGESTSAGSDASLCRQLTTLLAMNQLAEKMDYYAENIKRFDGTSPSVEEVENSDYLNVINVMMMHFAGCAELLKEEKEKKLNRQPTEEESLAEITGRPLNDVSFFLGYGFESVPKFVGKWPERDCMPCSAVPGCDPLTY